MIIDGVSLIDLETKNPSFLSNARATFVRFLEKKYGAKMLYDARHIASGRPDLLEPLQLGRLLREKGVISHLFQVDTFPDEPRIKLWQAMYDSNRKNKTAGASWDSESDALYAVLAESLERYIWKTQDDYFRNPLVANVQEIGTHGAYIDPQSFAGFSDTQRNALGSLALSPEAKYLWIQGSSLTKGGAVYVPAQVASAAQSVRARVGKDEPLIRQSTTSGLATWRTLAGARVRGILELIEREAYFSMWLNQLSLPKIDLSTIKTRNSTLHTCIETCTQYGLKIHAVRLLTDAPTYAIAVVIEDLYQNTPRFTVGLKAHWSLEYAIQNAAIEALRARYAYRRYTLKGNVWDKATPVEKIGHRDRLYYWGVKEHAKHLEFMIGAPEMAIGSEVWDSDDEEKHLDRILAWCRKKDFDCIAVSLGISTKNPTPWHVEMLIVPQLFPVYLDERLQAFSSTRWREIPESFGYHALEKPFTDAPHPFS